MQKLNRQNKPSPIYPLRVLQFGGGNFLRGFVDYFLDIYNEKTGEELGIGVIKVTPDGDYNNWKAQDGLYQVRTRGLQQGALINATRLITSISRIIHAYEQWDTFLATAHQAEIRYLFSNTTESGLQLSAEDQLDADPPISFPAKLCRWLYQRYQYFKGSPEAGCIIIPCELVANNGKLLRNLLMQCAEEWGLELDFIRWMAQSNTFCNTLVDRIVPGISQEKLSAAWEEMGWEDQLATEGEPYHLFVIENSKQLSEELPLDKVGLNIVFTDDCTPYRERKVKILNGAHTSLAPVAYLSGLRTVRETVEHPTIRKFLNRLLKEEILPSLDMPDSVLQEYAASVIDRFKNPYIDHYWSKISLHSFAKWKVRLLPGLVQYLEQHGKPPPLMSFSLACLIQYYQGNYQGEVIELNDEALVLERLKEAWKATDKYAISHKVLKWTSHWDQDLSLLPGLQELIIDYLNRMEKESVLEIIQELVSA